MKTEKNELKSEYNDSDKIFKEIFYGLTSAFALCELLFDKTGKPSDYRFIKLNAAFEKHTGLKINQTIGKTVREIYPDVEPFWIDKYSDVVLNKKTVQFVDYNHNTKKYFKVNAFSPSENKFVMALEDISNEKRLEDEIKKQDSFQDSLLKSFSDIIYIYDIQQNKNIYVNNPIEKILGYAPEEIKNIPNVISYLMHPDDFINYCEHIIPRYQTAADDDLIDHEFRMKSKKGGWVWLYSRESIYKRDENGIPLQIFGLIIDITEKKQLENKLEKARLLLKDTGKLGKIGGWELDLITGETFLTEETYKLYELSLNTKLSIEDGIKYYPLKNRPIIRNLVNKAIENGESYKFESLLTTAKGNNIYIRTQGKVYFENGMPVRLYGTIQDITESKKLLSETKKLSTALEQSPNSIVITDLKGNIEYTNPKFTEITGYSAEEVLGKNPRILNSGNETKAYYSNLWETILAGNVWTGELENKTKSGLLFWEEASITPIKNEDGEPVNYLAIKKDITTLKKASIKLKKQNKELLQLGNELSIKNNLLIETKNKFQNLFEKSPVSIWEQDFSEVMILLNKKKAEVKDLTAYINDNFSFVKECISKIKILNVNEKTLDLIGVKNVEELTKHIRKTNTEKAFSTLKDELLSIASGEKDFFSETEFIKTDGSTIYVIIRSTMLNEFGKNIASIVDITARKKGEEDLVKAKEKAEESDMLKTEFINNMSHEIRTPMNGILGFSDLLSNTDLTTQKRNNFIRIIQSSGRQLLHIIDDILEISKLGTKQVKVQETEVCLNDVLMELFSIFESKAKESAIPLYFKKQLTDEQSTILTDKLKLNKVLGNLLENALKYTNEGFVEFGYQLIDTEIELFVKDTGIGINKENHAKIFERFAQEEKNLSSKTGGLGLGLSIAKENAELLGGNIRLKSEKNEGSTFFVTIPYKPVFTSVTLKDTDEATDHKCVILIAEDEEVNFLYLDTLLKGIIPENCEILHAKNGSDAVEACKFNNSINLVFMDLKMPVLNGYEATKQIKQISPNLIVIAQTAYVTKNEHDQATLAGCEAVISKPITSEVVKSILQKYFNKI
ncbi:PAS domain S-box-containing protein [Lutibacter agarilyticus]|uniref:histidine kinase n=1 Tax=Lutibacter agarilyticus TaxID=1109740 RepID=A0A238WDB0_9FLAO|nr:PAS domain S-box protein [Lutibacter agarilyticus]SNR44407.1 PAS domain S-box-containing protein [Lutibacter agarilyticus]